ncbi:MAG: acyl-CoA dehydrogenase family protein [Burkholderiales bacterium]|nr:acyl-CoA dehydrogenase family protein [Burkholderiales bacterium]
MTAPVFAPDPLVADAAERAFADLARSYYAQSAALRTEAREALLAAVERLGFSDALPAPDGRKSWAQAAPILRAQARAAAPIDMAWLLATGDRQGAIAYDPERYDARGGPLPEREESRLALALGRLQQIGAALESALELTLGYVRDRRQFGRALAQFQAIQHSLALGAEDVAATNAAADWALACAATEGLASARLPYLLDCAALVAGRAIERVRDVCHQAHGAIGFTREYALARYSLDLLRWRDSLFALRGGELACAERLGDRALVAKSLWRALTAAMNSGGTEG